VLPELNPAQSAVGSATASPGSETSATGGSTRSDRRQAHEAGYIADAAVRRAIEERAVAIAKAHYSGAYSIQDVGSTRPYDLLLTRKSDGAERHVEEKGSTGNAEVVELTHGEVNHARTFQPTDLFVVSGISWRREDNQVIASGGTKRLLPEWQPTKDSLKPIRFRHKVPKTP
jgi:hypothetical protein